MQNVLAAGGQKQDKTLSDSAMRWADSREGFSHEGGIQFGFALNIEMHITIDRVSISLSYLTAFKFTLFVRTDSIVSKHFSCYSASCKKCIFLEPRNRVTRPRRVDLSFPFLELLLCWLCKEEHGFLYGRPNDVLKRFRNFSTGKKTVKVCAWEISHEETTDGSPTELQMIGRRLRRVHIQLSSGVR